jgi:hypothetical protein
VNPRVKPVVWLPEIWAEEEEKCGKKTHEKHEDHKKAEQYQEMEECAERRIEDRGKSRIVKIFQ